MADGGLFVARRGDVAHDATNKTPKTVRETFAKRLLTGSIDLVVLRVITQIIHRHSAPYSHRATANAHQSLRFHCNVMRILPAQPQGAQPRPTRFAPCDSFPGRKRLFYFQLLASSANFFANSLRSTGVTPVASLRPSSLLRLPAALLPLSSETAAR